MRKGVVCLALAFVACGTAHPSAVGSPSAATSTSVEPTVPAGLWPRTTNLAYDSTRGQVLLHGGYGREILGDTWTLDGSRWTQRLSATHPSARYGAAVSDDPDHHVVLLFGGIRLDDYRGDTWLWNGSEWHQVVPAHSPSPRHGAAITYDPVHHVVLLFGGWNGNPMSDTWVWDGNDWTAITPTKSPPARYYARLAFDIARGDAVLFGGFRGRADTWTWDGSTWKEQHPANAPPANNDATPFPSQMAYDAARRVIISVNVAQHSSLGSEDTAETWTWNGSTWTLLAAVTPLRYNNGLTYDAKHSVAVLAGGFARVGADPLSTWGWNGSTWSKIG